MAHSVQLFNLSRMPIYAAGLLVSLAHCVRFFDMPPSVVSGLNILVKGVGPVGTLFGWFVGLSVRVFLIKEAP